MKEDLQWWERNMQALDRFVDKVAAYVDLYNPEKSMERLATERTEGVKVQ